MYFTSVIKKTTLTFVTFLASLITLFIIETQLPRSVLAPTKHCSRQGEGKAVVPTSSDLRQGDSCQRLQGLREKFARLSFPQAQLTTGVQAPGEQLTICEQQRQTAELCHTNKCPWV